MTAIPAAPPMAHPIRLHKPNVPRPPSMQEDNLSLTYPNLPTASRVIWQELHRPEAKVAAQTNRRTLTANREACANGSNDAEKTHQQGLGIEKPGDLAAVEIPFTSGRPPPAHNGDTQTTNATATAARAAPKRASKIAATAKCDDTSVASAGNLNFDIGQIPSGPHDAKIGSSHARSS
eukprot:CAMPEP_0115705598 /NCGR_PEP_ID=MMETSP0272-20121206/70308_1 /TAXON_ID=71861 /ORGANISM="Scrippsiella trochoidea, Strain CCMP3099" /LENGTH=177 /DNA_ID=CAMNT_0003146721 /DNA_START=282 /DNA_END=818 /DNA_ORIENTATION=-